MKNHRITDDLPSLLKPHPLAAALQQPHGAADNLSRLLALAAESLGIAWVYWDFSGSDIRVEIYNCPLADGNAAGLQPVSNWVERIQADDRERVANEVRQCLTEQGRLHIEFRLYANGIPYDLVCTTAFEYSDTGQPLRGAGLIQDVTRRKAAEDNARVFKSLCDQSPDGHVLFDGLTLRIVYANRSYCEGRGYSEAELLQMTVCDIDAHGSLKRFRRMMEQIKHGTSQPTEAVHRRKDGSLFPVEIISTYLEIDGRPHLFSQIRDISLRKQAEMNAHFLMQLDALFSKAGDPDAIEQTVVDRLGRYLKVDRCTFAEVQGDTMTIRHEYKNAFEDSTVGSYPVIALLNQDAQDMLRRGQAIVVTDTQTDPRTEHSAAFCASRGIASAAECPVVYHGQWVATLGVHSRTPRHWADHELQLLHDTAQRVWPILTLMRTVDALHVSKQRLSQAQFAARCGIWEWDIVNDVLHLSTELHELLGVHHDPVLDYESGLQLVAPDDRQRLAQSVHAALAGDAEELNEEFRIPDTTLGLAWVDLRGKISRDEHGRPIRIVGVTLDITERKRTEAALKESEEQLRMALDAADIGMWSWKPSHNLTCLDARCQAIYELPSTQAQQQENVPAYLINHVVHPDDRPLLTHALLQALDPQGDGKLSVEHRVIRQDGSVRHLLCKGAAQFEGDGDERRVTHIVGLVSDLTERKQAEEALRISEERYRFAVEASSGVLYDLNVRSGLIERSTGIKDIFGYEPEEAEPSLRWWQEHIRPEDRAAYQAGFEEAVRHRDPTYECEYDVRHRDGRWLTVSDKARMIYDAGGSLIRVVGSRVDITAAKHAEQALRDSEQMLALIYDNSSDSLYLIKVEPEDAYRFISVNQTFLQISGLSKTDVCDKPIEEVIPGDNLDLSRHYFRHVAAAGQAAVYRTTILTGDSRREGEVTLIPITGPDGAVTHILGSIKDVTARVHAEEALRASEEHLRLALEGGRLGTWDIDFERGMVRYDERAQAIIGRPGQAELTIAESYAILYSNEEPAADTLSDSTSGYDFNHAIEWPDGSTHWVSARGQVIFKGEGEDRQGVRLVGVLSDVTERKRIEDQLRQREAFISAINNTARVAICVYDLAEKQLMYANRYFEQILGFSLDELHALRTRELIRLVHPDDIRSLTDFLKKCRAAKDDEALMHEYRVRHKHDGYRWLQANNAPFARDSYGGVKQILVVLEDITERKHGEEALRASEARYRALVHATSTAVWRMNAEGSRRLSIVGAGIYSRNEPDEHVGAWLEFVHPEDRDQTAAVWNAAVQSGGLYEIEHRLQMADGSYHYFHSRAVPVLDEVGEILEWMGSSVDISERKEAEAALQEAEEHALAYQREQIRLANEDALTALPNRHWLMNYLPKALEQARASGSMLAVLFVDLDEFKIINDTLGHAVGDELLHAAAMRLKRAVRPYDHVVRLGGDEFTLILDPIETAGDAAEIADRITKAFREPFSLSRGNKSVGASIGISLFPKNGADVGTLLKHADIAMYASKAAGKSRYCFYEDEFYRKLQARREAEHALIRALENDQLVLHYQPRVDTFTGELRSMEALVRWVHPERGLVLPQEFIALAEETGAILRLGEIVLKKACTQIVDWQKQNLPLVPVSINVSARQFGLGNVNQHFAATIAQHAIDPRLVELEITESSMMGKEAQVDEQLYALRESGIKLLIDDFGTGYSSLSQLQRLDMDVLKVDQAFTAELDKTVEGEVFFKAIVSMAHALGMSVVAEGVENLMQLKMLQALSCDEVQGHFISKPVTAEVMSELMRRPSLLPPQRK